MTEWISVKDALPDTHARAHGSEDKLSNHLLLYSKEYGIVKGFLEQYDEETYDWFVIEIHDDRLIKGITHWMPLPMEPKE